MINEKLILETLTRTIANVGGLITANAALTQLLSVKLPGLSPEERSKMQKLSASLVKDAKGVEDEVTTLQSALKNYQG